MAGFARFATALLMRGGDRLKVGAVPNIRHLAGLVRDLWGERLWPQQVGPFDRERYRASERLARRQVRARPDGQLEPGIIALLVAQPCPDTTLRTFGHGDALPNAFRVVTVSEEPDGQTVHAEASGAIAGRSVADLPADVQYVAPLLSGDSLDYAGLPSLLDAVVEHRGAIWWYTDEDVPDHEGRSLRHAKGRFNPELALVNDYATRLAVIRRSALPHTLPLRDVLDERWLGQRLLQLVESGASEIVSVPAVCVRRARPMSGSRVADMGTAELVRRGAAGAVTDAEPASWGFPVVRWADVADGPNSVTVVMPSRNRPDLVRSCVESIVRTADPALAEVILVDDDSDPDTRGALSRLSAEFGPTLRVLHVPRAGRPFNYARLINVAARAVRTALMLHLNDDVEALAPGWLRQLAGWFGDSAIGAVGPQLLRPDGSIQHAGVVLNARQGLPMHAAEGLRGSPGTWPGPSSRRRPLR